MINLKAKLHPFTANVLSQPEYLLNLSHVYNGPLHLIFPRIMDENINKFKTVFEEFEVNGIIHYAHKSNKSIAFAKQALKNNVNIDVSSYNELVSALTAGFQGKQISCTGVKNSNYLYLCILQSCLISVDNLQELESIIDLANRLNKSAQILIRIADVSTSDRNFTSKTSRFGIAKKDLDKVFNLLKNNTLLNLKGFHFHNDVKDADIKAGFINDLIEMSKDSYAKGYSPDIINVGGGFRTAQLEDFSQWSSFLESLEENILNSSLKETWRGYKFGMSINNKGKISGREKIQGEFTNTDFKNVVSEILDNSNFERAIKDRLNELFFSIMIEPGFALLQQCGISLFKVIGTKTTAENENLIIIDGNIYNLSSQMREIFMDPILVSKNNKTKDAFSGFIIGNLCKEDDVIMKRKVYFENKPKAGDLICFANTAAYISDFEDANPHQHPNGKKLVLVEDSNHKIIALDENLYNPFLK